MTAKHFLISFSLLLSLCAADPTIVNTTYGPIQGRIFGTVVEFQSIPYAKPPIGELRWTMAQPPDPWTNIKKCDTDPPKCIQGGFFEKISEDCLFLNVFTPLSCVNDNTNSCAVMLWIHGGSYLVGYGGGEGFNGTYMASLTNVIVVTINYRLGALGFLWNPELGLYGNYGHMDQTFAIEWTADNIAAFGGDPNQIFIYGESAGNIMSHYISKHTLIYHS